MRVGITGGIGSGKTTVCRFFQALGVPVYDADAEARRLVEVDPALRRGIVQLLGEAAYLPDGRYNRAYVAGIVFHDPDKLASLNALVHPAVEAHSRAWHEARMAEGCTYTLKEAALLVESGAYRRLDKLIVVTAPEELRVRRVMARDGLDEPAVLARMRSQMPESEKVARADFVVVNDEVQMLAPQVWKIHRSLASG